MKLNVPGLSVEDVGGTGIIVVFKWTCVVVSSEAVVNVLDSDANVEVPNGDICVVCAGWIDVGRSVTVDVVRGISVVGVTIDVDIIIVDESVRLGLDDDTSIVVSDENVDIRLTSSEADVDGSILAAGDVTGVAPDEGIDVVVFGDIVVASDESSVHIAVPAQ